MNHKTQPLSPDRNSSRDEFDAENTSKALLSPMSSGFSRDMTFSPGMAFFSPSSIISPSRGRAHSLTGVNFSPSMLSPAPQGRSPRKRGAPRERSPPTRSLPLPPHFLHREGLRGTTAALPRDRLEASSSSSSSSSWTRGQRGGLDSRIANDGIIISGFPALESPHDGPRDPRDPAGLDLSPPSHPLSRCNCRKSKCLKLYCECFTNLRYCMGCNCHDCYNTRDHEPAREEAIKATKERNSSAFVTKVNAGKSHATGCHCKNSQCLKKYCECFQASAFCGGNCKCLSCQNFSGSAAMQSSGVLSSGRSSSSSSSSSGIGSVSGSGDKRRRGSPTSITAVLGHGSPPDMDDFIDGMDYVEEPAPDQGEGQGQDQLLLHHTATSEVAELQGHGQGLSRFNGSVVAVRGDWDREGHASGFGAEFAVGRDGIAPPLDEHAGPVSTPLTIQTHQLEPQSRPSAVVAYAFFGTALPPVTKRVALTILDFLCNRDLYQVSQASTFWARAAVDDALWASDSTPGAAFASPNYSLAGVSPLPAAAPLSAGGASSKQATKVKTGTRHSARLR